MTIATGDKLPEASFLEKGPEGIAPVTSAALLGGRRVALFAVPGAYTGVCSTQHVPSFIRVADRLRAKGVDDPHVMMAWGEATGASAAGIRMLADAGAEFTRAMGLDYDNPGAGMFSRSKRYALYAEDGVVKVFNLEASTGACEISAGETLLGQV
jgi:peroxiredoxin